MANAKQEPRQPKSRGHHTLEAYVSTGRTKKQPILKVFCHIATIAPPAISHSRVFQQNQAKANIHLQGFRASNDPDKRSETQSIAPCRLRYALLPQPLLLRVLSPLLPALLQFPLPVPLAAPSYRLLAPHARLPF